MDLVSLVTSIPGVGPVVPYLVAFGGVCAVVATVLPPPAAPTGAYAALYKAVNWAALNIGHAKNAGAPK
jgi:hypothetical protein